MERTITIGKFDFVATPLESGVAVALIYGGKELNITDFEAKRDAPTDEMLSTQDTGEDLFLCANSIKETLILLDLGLLPVPEDVEAFKADVEELCELMNAQAEALQETQH